ncbi:MAG: hypothetical protein V2A71_03665, partial [Candidatus Eisenbacteria bacterium]
ELADYVYCRDHVQVEESERAFRLDFSFARDIRRQFVTLLIADMQIREIRTPAGDVVSAAGGVFNVPIMKGLYRLA